MVNSCRILVRNRLGDMEVDKIDMKIGLRKTECESVDCTHVAQDGAQWQAVMRTVMNIPVP
jgi:hypothetical protein